MADVLSTVTEVIRGTTVVAEEQPGGGVRYDVHLRPPKREHGQFPSVAVKVRDGQVADPVQLGGGDGTWTRITFGPDYPNATTEVGSIAFFWGGRTIYALQITPGEWRVEEGGQEVGRLSAVYTMGQTQPLEVKGPAPVAPFAGSGSSGQAF